MPERPGQSKPLIVALLGDDSIAQEAAAARLAIVGTPAVRNLLKAIDGASPEGVVRLVAVLERIGDPSALPTLRRLLASDDTPLLRTVVDALAVHLTSSHARASAAALDAIAAIVLDTQRDARVRLHALRSLDALDPVVTAPLRAQLLSDADASVRAHVRDEGPRPEHAMQADTPDDHLVQEAAEGRLPAVPDALRRAIVSGADTLPLTMIHRAIERLRVHEAQVGDETAREQWRLARAAAHQALAARGSRLAVYDLRETVDALGADTPVGMLSAMQQVGDAPALESIADAWTRTGNAWFRSQLAATFRTIVEREGVTRRHAVVKKLAARAPETLAALWPAATSR